MATVNPLAPRSGPDLATRVAGAFDQAQAMFKSTSKALAHVRMMDESLTRLAKLGDVVSHDDVIGEAGKLVSRGSFSANEMATVLSDMPVKEGAPLAAWVQGHLQRNAQLTQQVQQYHALARHEMGASAMRALLQDHAAQSVGAFGQGVSDAAGSALGAPGPLMS